MIIRNSTFFRIKLSKYIASSLGLQFYMQECHFLKNRFTIHEFRMPFAGPEMQSHLQKKGRSLIAHYQSEKKILCNPEERSPKLLRRERMSEELQCRQEESEYLGSLPQIRNKSKTLEVSKLHLQQKLHSFSSRKLNVNAYRKIEKSISNKYIQKMESLALSSLKPKKLFCINNLKTDLPFPKSNTDRVSKEDKSLQKGAQFTIIEKHHIDPLKDHFQIPMELQTLKCQQQEYDNHQINLQIKNMIRFQFNTQLQFKSKKQPQKKEEKVMRIDGWQLDHEPLRAYS